ncbi:cleavage and polyadenylation specificity factor subunit 1 [Pseudohyphozyma bogoriensis]|nr:cleavage and polyadenylation specificity factor subunit 1 [Pseudohyphozyma bogoriensis]
MQQPAVAYHKQLLPPSGYSHALSVRLIPLGDDASTSIISHLVTARDSLLQVWEVREVPKVGGVDGETTAKLHHVLSRRLHGSITALSRVRTLASKQDGADRILVSFKDAKMSLMEWTPAAHDLLPISLHTFEKLPQVARLTLSATDPSSRLSVLLLPTNTGGDGTLAILPFFQEEIDLESLGVDAEAWGSGAVASIPYAASHLLPLSTLTSSHSSFAGPSKSTTLFNPTSASLGPPPVRNVIDMVFLPGFNEPTLALLYAPELTWTGRLENMSNNCLVSLVTLVPDSGKGGAREGGETTAVVIATSPALPHSSLSIHPCPPDLGGVVIVTANGILHLEQGGKVVGTPANGWFGKEWHGPGSRVNAVGAGEATVRQEMEGARVVFIANHKALVYTKTGLVLELALTTSGRSVTSMKLSKAGNGVAASCVERIRGSAGRFGEKGYVFVGSEVGESVLMSWEIASAGGAAIQTSAWGSAGDAGGDMDLDDDEDLYGTSEVAKPVVVVAPTRKTPKYPLTLEVCDMIASYGGIRGLAIGLVDEDSDAELVASTGSGPTSGFTVFHISVDVPGSPIPDVTTEDVTIAVASVLEETAIIRVTTQAVQLIESDLQSEHSVSVSLNSPVTRAIIAEPFILVIGAKNDSQLLSVNPKTRQLSVEDPPEFLNTQLSAVSLFTDTDNIIPLVRPAPPSSKSTSLVAPAAEEDDNELYGSAPRRPIASDLKKQSDLIIPSETPRQWIPIVDAAGDLKIYLLPSFTEVFSAKAVALFPDVLNDGEGGSFPEGIDEDDIQIDRISCFFILLSNGSFAAYEAIPSISAAATSSRPESLGVRFVKTVTKRLPTLIARRPKRGAVDQDVLEPPRREFVPFTGIQGYTGAFVTGEDPFWILASDHGPAHIYDHGEKAIYGFSKNGFAETAFGTAGADYVVQSKADVAVAMLPEHICFDREMPYLRVPRDRQYAQFTFDIDSGLYVAGALFSTEFMNFDEEGKPIFVDDTPELTDPTNYRSVLELVLPGTWQAIDGYEFRPNEFVSTVKSVSLATRSTATGRKDFIAVGTTVYRAEDLAARGGLYLFEVVKIVADPATPTIDHRLKLLSFEDTKSVVGNLCDLDGYLALSMGQKLYVRAFEQDEVLIAVGFLDVGVHVTSLQSIKNFLLIGDALQSVTLVAFQEDPYKLVHLGRDYRPSQTASANFLVNEGKVAFVVADIYGVLRLFEYDPANIASQAGQKLLCRTEYNAGAEGSATMLFVKRSGTDDIKQNGILYGGADGSLYTLVPVRDAVFKRLQLLQSQLTKYVQHFGGLNPRGYRIVKNDSVSRAITKGILDGELLARFEWLSLDKQLALAEMVGTDVDTTALNLRNLSSSF